MDIGVSLCPGLRVPEPHRDGLTRLPPRGAKLCASPGSPCLVLVYSFAGWDSGPGTGHSVDPLTCRRVPELVPRFDCHDEVPCVFLPTLLVDRLCSLPGEREGNRCVTHRAGVRGFGKTPSPPPPWGRSAHHELGAGCLRWALLVMLISAPRVGGGRVGFFLWYLHVT